MVLIDSKSLCTGNDLMGLFIINIRWILIIKMFYRPPEKQLWGCNGTIRILTSISKVESLDYFKKPVIYYNLTQLAV